MSYEYKDYFKTLNIKESRKNDADINEAFIARDELNEVYRKAKAFDEIIEAYEDKDKSIDQVYKVVDEMHTQVLSKARRSE